MKSNKAWKAWEDSQAGRPGQAEPGEPHWIVMNLSRHKQLPLERRIAFYFRHPTQESANTEARRLAEKHPGQRFAVYASAMSVKLYVEGPQPQDVEGVAQTVTSITPTTLLVAPEGMGDDLRWP